MSVTVVYAYPRVLLVWRDGRPPRWHLALILPSFDCTAPRLLGWGARVEGHQMPHETILRAKAQAAILAGKLPSRRPDRVWGGPGVGAVCAVCDLPVTKGEMEFEIEFAHDGDSPGLDKFRVHIRCFAAWEFERRSAP